MKLAYVDCIGGASGDMLLGALLDAGLPLERLRSDLDALHLPGYTLTSEMVSKNGFRAVQVDVQVSDQATERHLADILAVLHASSLPEAVRQPAEAIFRRLAEIEAGIHGLPLEQVHLHELGGLDTIVDVVGGVAGLHALQVEQVFVSPFPLGGGWGRSAHGPLPLPAPATLAILRQAQAPIIGRDLQFETVTPTGAAILCGVAAGYGPIPAMRLQRVGYGAGRRDLPTPNLLRLLVGESLQQNGPAAGSVETLATLESNIDDLNPELYEHVMARLLAAGALDVTLTPVQMKKNRPAVQIGVLCRPAQVDALQGILFAETSTLGVRRAWVERHALPRRVQTVETPYGAVQVKLAEWAPGEWKAAPEYEDCRRLAQQSGQPLWKIYQSALEHLADAT